MSFPTLNPPSTLRRAAALALLASAALTAPAHADLAGYRAAVMADSPLAYWQLDELSGSAADDSSGNSHGGTYGGGVTLGAAAPFGAPANTAARLDATGTMTAQVPGTMKAVEFWVRPSQRVRQTFLRYGDPALDGWSISMNGGGAPGNLKRRLTFTASGKVTSLKTMLPVGAWSMVYVSWGPGNQLRVALNGGAVSKSPVPGGLPNATPALAPLVIGPGAGSGGTTLDEVALYAGRPDPAPHFDPSSLPLLTAAPGLSPLTGVKAGQTLTLTPGAWNDGTSVSDSWQRCDSVGACQPIAGATGTTYVTQPGDVGFTIQIQETGTSPAGAVVVYTDATDPIADADGSQPPAPPVLPPGSDPAVPSSDSQAAIDAGGVVTDPSGPGDTTGGTPPGTTGESPSDSTSSPAGTTSGGAFPASTEVPSACVARLAPLKAVRRRIRGVGAISIRVDAARRIVTVRAKRRALKRVRWSLDGKPLRTRGRGTAVSFPAVAPGDHTLRARLTPRRARQRTLRLTLSARCA